MVFHGTVVVLLGLAAGFPQAFVITGQLEGSERAWRMAHLEGLLNGLLVLAVAVIADRLVLGRWRHALLAWSLVVAAYGNVVAAILAAVWRVRGLTPAGPATNLIVYVLFMIAIVAVFLGLGLLAVEARRRGWAAETVPDATL
jgi:hypothetical protein